MKFRGNIKIIFTTVAICLLAAFPVFAAETPWYSKLKSSIFGGGSGYYPSSSTTTPSSGDSGSSSSSSYPKDAGFDNITSDNATFKNLYVTEKLDLSGSGAQAVDVTGVDVIGLTVDASQIQGKIPLTKIKKIYNKDIAKKAKIKRTKILGLNKQLNSKLSLTGGDIAGDLNIDGAFTIDASSQPENAEAGQIYLNSVDNKLYYYNGTTWIDLTMQSTTYTAGSGLTLTDTEFSIDNSAITNDMLQGSIAYSKLDLTGAVTNADISNTAALAYSKLDLAGAVTNADLAGSIADSKVDDDLTISGGTIDDTPIGATTASTADFSKISLNAAPVKLESLDQLPRANIITNLVGPNDWIEVFSVTIGSDGYPIFVYNYEQGGDYLPATYHCTSYDCSTGESTDYTSTESYDSSITIGTDGYPVISYHDWIAGDLYITKCGDLACTQANATTTLVDSTGNVGGWNSIAIGTDGYPIVSYVDWDNKDLKVYHCTNASCTTGLASTVDNAATVDTSRTSITIGSDGLPVISYYDGGVNDNLKVAKCNEVACTGGDETLTNVDTVNDVGRYSAITLGNDGFPSISYHDTTNTSLMFCKCTNDDCSGNSCTTLDNSANMGYYTDITLGEDGFPVISHFDIVNEKLKVARCGNADCSTVVTKTLDSSTTVAAGYQPITIGIDGKPVIGYTKENGADYYLRALHAGNDFFVDYWTRR